VTEFGRLISVLAAGGVEFIIIGGIAASAHGSAHATIDLDIVYNRTPENMRRLAAALAPFAPYLRGAPPGLPFSFDAETIRRGLNFTLTTTLGDLDALGEAAGNGVYDRLLPLSHELVLFDTACRVVDLEPLIELKRAAGRPKDLERIAELEALREESDQG
jgi:hypothetical protein